MRAFSGWVSRSSGTKKRVPIQAGRWPVSQRYSGRKDLRVPADSVTRTHQEPSPGAPLWASVREDGFSATTLISAGTRHFSATAMFRPHGPVPKDLPIREWRVTGEIAREGRVGWPGTSGHHRPGSSGRRPSCRAGKKSVRRAHRILPARYVGVQVADGLRLVVDNRVDQVAD